MGRINLDCLTVNHNKTSIYGIGIAYPDNAPDAYQSLASLVLVRSEPGPLSISDVKWSVVSIIKADLVPFYWDLTPGAVDCAISKAGVFSAMVKNKELRMGGENVWRGVMYDPTLAQGDYTSKDLWKVFAVGGGYTLNDPLVRFHGAIYLDQPIPTNMTGSLPAKGAIRERFIHGVSGNSSSVLQLTSFGPEDKDWKDSNPSHWVMASILSSSLQPCKGYHYNTPKC
jgi:hypothetical protein